MTFPLIRILDIIISVLILLFFAPLIITISILIFLIDGRPIYFKQLRVGYKGEKFSIFKFRTMKTVVLKNDKLRLTTLGKILRKTSLDELPQFINVLKKEMSIVGPRPLPTFIEKKIHKSIRLKRRKVLPGITGLSQVNFSGRNRKLTEKVKLDLKFIDNYSLYSYANILLKTPSVLILRLIRNKSSIIK